LSADPSEPVSAANELLGPEHGHGLGEGLLRQLSSSLAEGLTTNFWIIAAMAVLAFAVGLLFPRVKPGATPTADGAAMH
ncbi:MAG TPA: MFS transporter, partial [Hyalangium sp.]|nr:MFS transporter [Hyalangium sp.]